MVFSLDQIRRHHANNISTLVKSPLSEISGSLGDLGTLLPLMIALAINNSISLSTTLVFSGLWNIVTGILFGIPLPVQPMKAIAAVAISRKFSITETSSAGFTTSGVVFVLSVSGLLKWFSERIPVPVIKGIQVGAGLSLIISSGSTLLQPLGLTKPSWHDNLLWGLFAFFFLLTTHTIFLHSIHYALAIFLLGLTLSFLTISSNSLPSPQFWTPKVYLPSLVSFRTGALQAGLGQIPLTTLNSIIAIPSLSQALLPSISTPSVTAIGSSVSLMNLIGCWFGAMPVCHGSGGLAAQYRFGARSGASIILLGFFKLLLGLTFGSSLIPLLKVYPKSLLGVMVVAAGLELAKVGESLNHHASDLTSLVGLSDEERRERWMVMLMTVAGLLAFRNDGVGFLVGMACHFSFRISRSSERFGRVEVDGERRGLLEA